MPVINIPIGAVAYTLGCLSKQDDGSWKLTSIGLYSERSPTCHLLRQRYVEILPPVQGDDLGEAFARAREAFVAMGMEKTFAGVRLHGRLGDA